MSQDNQRSKMTDAKVAGEVLRQIRDLIPSNTPLIADILELTVPHITTSYAFELAQALCTRVLNRDLRPLQRSNTLEQLDNTLAKLRAHERIYPDDPGHFALMEYVERMVESGLDTMSARMQDNSKLLLQLIRSSARTLPQQLALSAPTPIDTSGNVVRFPQRRKLGEPSR
jgi:hypothetical protein